MLTAACDLCVLLFFFFQAEDGIRDRNVTGVQTCALPISPARSREGSTADVHAQAVVLTAMRLGVTVLHRHVGHALDTDVFSEEGVARVSLATLDLLAPGLVDTDRAESWRADLTDLPQRSEQPA